MKQRYSVSYLPQYEDKESKQQDACQDGYQNDPPGDRVLLCKIKLWVDHYWDLMSRRGLNVQFTKNKM